MDEQKTGGVKKWWVWGVVIVVIIIVLTYANSSRVPEGGYKIGAILSLTGSGAAHSQSTQRGMDVALEEINKNGKVLDVIYEDDQSSVEKTVSAFQKMVSIDNLQIIAGFMSSNSALAVAPIANDKKVVALNTLSASDDLRNAGDYIFRIREKSATHGEKMAAYIKNMLGLKKVALYYANAANSVSYVDAFKNEFIRLGGTVVFDEKYIEKSTDFRSDLLKMKTTDFEAVYLAGLATEMAQVLVQAKETGVNTKWFASAGAENPKLIEVAKGNAEGLIFTTPAFNPEQENGSMQKFTEAYKQKYGELPSFAAASGYDGVMLVYQVMKKYGYDAESIKKGLYATKDFPGVGGTFSFDEFGEVEKEIMFKVVKDGQFVKLSE